MTVFALVIAACGISAFLSLVLSVTPYAVAARRSALGALWLTLGAIPTSFVIEVASTWTASEGPESRAMLLGRTISQAINHGAALLPCAFIAGLALRRANSASRKRATTARGSS